MNTVSPEIKELCKGRYQVLSVLGAGGFGITYQCRDVGSGMLYAVKEYMPEAIASRDPDTGFIVPENDRLPAFRHGMTRFLEEAQTLMRIRKIPQVVSVWDYFEENGTVYYVMEFLEGKTLKQLMRNLGGKLPYFAAAEAIILAGNAMDRVHREAGVFHRDISPENIMVLPDGKIRIIDFGCAKSLSTSAGQKFSVVLKPGFAPPEQYASNLPQGSFTDVYALAGTFYYAASGVMIPSAPDRLSGGGYQSLSQLVPECNPSASLAVDRALALDSKFRTQSMWEFVQGIRAPSTHRVAAPHETVFPKEAAPLSQRQEPGERMTAWLEVVKGTCSGKRFPVRPNEPVCVGRTAGKSQIVLNGHPEISGLHFRLLYRPEKKGFYVIDESTNGIYYQGIRLKKGEKYKLQPGDQLGIGSMRCLVTVGVAPNEK